MVKSDNLFKPCCSEYANSVVAFWKRTQDLVTASEGYSHKVRFILEE